MERAGAERYGSLENIVKPRYSVGYQVSSPSDGLGRVEEVRAKDVSFEYRVHFASGDQWVQQERMQ